MDKELLTKLLHEKYQMLSSALNERGKRVWAAVEASSLGRGGVSIVANATGLSRTTIHEGLNDIQSHGLPDDQEYIKKQRKSGGGRQKYEINHPGIKKDLEELVESYTMGDPQSPLKWTCKSTYKLAEELKTRGYESISQTTVYNLLLELEYSVQSNFKSKEGTSHPDRDAQFKYIASMLALYQKEKNPVISVDAKKKENLGEFHNKGREWNPKGKPTVVNGHDFPDEKLGKVTPYGVYDIVNNKGWVSVGISSDTAEFAVQSIHNWWINMGKLVYPDATKLLITADCGGSNGNRIKLWKFKLQKLANDIGLDIQVCHLPPGTSKWNKIEHRMFSAISQNWRGRPLTSREVVVNLISHTTTKKGLKIKAQLDEKTYEKGIEVSEDMLKTVSLERDSFHGEWNYKVKQNQRIVQVN